MAPLLGLSGDSRQEGFLAGLVAHNIVGAASLPAVPLRRTAFQWIGLELADTGRRFEHIQAGCWVCGFPSVGRGRELLRLGGLADIAGLQGTLDEVGQTARGTSLYFNFHYDEAGSACERVYVLDAEAGRLHGFAFSRSALAPAKLK